MSHSGGRRTRLGGPRSPAQTAPSAGGGGLACRAQFNRIRGRSPMRLIQPPGAAGGWPAGRREAAGNKARNSRRLPKPIDSRRATPAKYAGDPSCGSLPAQRQQRRPGNTRRIILRKVAGARNGRRLRRIAPFEPGPAYRPSATAGPAASRLPGLRSFAVGVRNSGGRGGSGLLEFLPGRLCLV